MPKTCGKQGTRNARGARAAASWSSEAAARCTTALFPKLTSHTVNLVKECQQRPSAEQRRSPRAHERFHEGNCPPGPGSNSQRQKAQNQQRSTRTSCKSALAADLQAPTYQERLTSLAFLVDSGTWASEYAAPATSRICRSRRYEPGSSSLRTARGSLWTIMSSMMTSREVRSSW